MAEVLLEGVSKRFGSSEAVSNLDLRAGDGEFTVLLGPTGAGKTTTLRLVAGLEKPDAGIVRIGGRDVTAAPPAPRDVSFVFQQYSLYPHLSVYDNLAFPLRAPARRLPEPEIRTRVEQVAALLRIGDKLANRATQLSGGQMQRVAIGRALVRRPNVYLMDEPLSSLDAKLRAELRVELKRIQRDTGATLLYVTHDQTEALGMADRIAVMHGGRIVQFDVPEQVYRMPATRFVGSFIGNPPMNFIAHPEAQAALGCTPRAGLTLGIRPEDLQPVAEGGLVLQARVVEMLGASQQLTARVGDELLRVSLPALPGITTGQTLRLQAAPGAARWYDPEGNLCP